MIQPRNPFTRTGALARHDPLFLGRTAELAQLEQACLNDHKSFMLVYGGRQNGKTSLLLRLEASLRARLPERVRVCRVDFQDIPRVTTNAAFQHLIAELRRNLPHLPPAPATAGIPELRGFLEQALAGDEVSRLVLLMDELARLPEATREDIAHVIRALHTHRLVSPALAKTQFILAGGLELYNLAIVQASTLRNVCEIVRLGDLRETDAVTLIAEGLGLIGVAPEQARLLGRAVYQRVGGHPYLTQRIGGLLVESYFQGQAFDEELVEALCWSMLDEDDALLEHLRRSLVELQLEDAARRLLTASQRTSATDDHTARLELLGVARRAGRIWAPRSPLLVVALADWLGFTTPPSQTLAEVATLAQRAAQAGYIRDLKLEQAATAQRVAQAASAAEQVRLERRANDLAAEISRLEAAQAVSPASTSIQAEQSVALPQPGEAHQTAQPIVPVSTSEPAPATATPAAQAPATTASPAQHEPILVAPKPAPKEVLNRLPTRPPRSASLRIPELVHVPAGPFLMGSSEKDRLAIDNEKPQHELELPDYWIGKTPTTNAQFRAFVEGEGYRDSAYWIAAGWQWREQEHIVKPLFWDDAKRTGADYPVIGVSWYEAVAYCCWLSAQTGREFRLPSEAEWEKAARGGDGRIWPWGDRWEAKRANSKEAGLGKTTPVGQYPTGASPYGALDMAGNVWEWCTTGWSITYPYQIEDEWQTAYLAANGFRNARGGSWYNRQSNLRASCRGLSVSPRHRDFNVGLRVASHSRPDSGS